MKRGLLSLIPLLLSFASAYGGQAGQFIGGFYLDTNMIGAAIIFIILFWAISFGTSKLHMFGSKSARVVISLILALFSIYGLAKMGLSYEKLLINIGLNQILEIYFPHIIIAMLIICILIFGLQITLMLFGTIFILIGLIASQTPNMIYNWGVPLAIGVVILIIGLILRKKYPHKYIGKLKLKR